MGNIDVYDDGSYTQYTEQSEAGGVLVCTEDEHGTLDHTWQEIHDANCAVVRYDSGDRVEIHQILKVDVDGNIPPRYTVESFNTVTDDHLTYTLERELYVAQTAHDYPAYL